MQEPKGSVKRLKVYAKSNRKSLLILEEGEDGGIEK